MRFYDDAPHRRGHESSYQPLPAKYSENFYSDLGGRFSTLWCKRNKNKILGNRNQKYLSKMILRLDLDIKKLFSSLVLKCTISDLLNDFCFSGLVGFNRIRHSQIYPVASSLSDWRYIVGTYPFISSGWFRVIFFFFSKEYNFFHKA